MAKLNHWIEQLPGFGASFTILQLFDEKKDALKSIEENKKRVLEIEEEVTRIVENCWTEEEINQAKYLGSEEEQ